MCVRAQANIITWPATPAAYRVSGGLLLRLVALGLVVGLPNRPRLTNMIKQARLTMHFSWLNHYHPGAGVTSYTSAAA